MNTGSSSKQWLGIYRPVCLLVADRPPSPYENSGDRSGAHCMGGLLDRLGIFAPYVRTIEGAACRDQGIEIQVLGALADDLEGYVYLAVRDVDGDRLDECLTLKGRLTTGTKRAPDDGKPTPAVNIVGSGSFSLLSYDPDTRTALLSASIFYGDTAQPSRDAQLSVTGMSTREGDLHAELSCGSVTGETLEPPSGRGGRGHLTIRR